jgi:hypothetical protein
MQQFIFGYLLRSMLRLSDRSRKRRLLLRCRHDIFLRREGGVGQQLSRYLGRGQWEDWARAVLALSKSDKR